MSVKNLLLQPALKDLMKDPAGNLLNVGFTAISDSDNLRQNKYQKELPTLSQTIDKHLHSSITSQLGRNGVVGVLNGRYLQLDLIYKLDWMNYLEMSWNTNTKPLGLTGPQYQRSMTQLGIFERAITQEYLPACQVYSIRRLPNQSMHLFGM